MEKTIAFGKERYPGERRVMIMPREVALYRDAGFSVLVEAGAGEGSGAGDRDYEAAGAAVVAQEQAWAQRYLVKYKCPEPEEYRFMHTNLTLAGSLHAEGNEALLSAFCQSGATAYTLEYFVTPEGIRPLPVTDMEIAGRTAFLYGAYHLQTHFGGSGILLSHIHGVARPRVLVIGYGNVGGAAARAAAAFGCEVTVLGTNRAKLRQFASTMPPGVSCLINTPESFDAEIAKADLVLGAILISLEDTPAMLDKHHLKMMKPGSMIIDITCGHGDGKGWMPTFPRGTKHEDPVYVVDGILHCKIDRIPSHLPATASQAKSVNVAPYLIDLGNAIYSGRSDPLAETGKIVERGRIVNAYMRSTLSPTSTLLAA